MITVGATIYTPSRSQPYKVVGETSRSWLIKSENASAWERAVKIPKKSTNQRDIWTLDSKEWKDSQWGLRHRYEISERVNRLRDGALLRKVAALVGWAPCKCGHAPTYHDGPQGKCSVRPNHGLPCPCAAFDPEEL